MFLYIWLALSLISVIFIYSASLAHFQRAWPSLANEHKFVDVMVSLLASVLGILMGPLSLVLAYFMMNGFKQGFMFWPTQKRQKNRDFLN